MATSPQQLQCPGLMIGMVCMKYEHLVNFHICVFFLGTLDKKLIENNLDTTKDINVCNVLYDDIFCSGSIIYVNYDSVMRKHLLIMKQKNMASLRYVYIVYKRVNF